MLTSPLQLEHSVLGEVVVRPNPGPEWTNSIEVEATPEFSRNESDLALWQVQMPVTFRGSEGKAATYEGRVEVVGYFRVVQSDLPEENQLRLIAVNAPAMLFSAAREVVANLTARGRNGPFLLPSVTFVDIEITKQPPPDEKKRVKQVKRAMVPALEDKPKSDKA